MRGAPAVLIATLAATACFETPDYEGRLCGTANACPAGYACGSDERCHRQTGQNLDAGVNRDAQAAPADATANHDATADATAPEDALTSDAFAPDMGGDAIDAGPPDTGIREVISSVMNTQDDAMEGPPNGDTLVDYAWASMYSDLHWGGVRIRVPDIDANDQIIAATLQLYFDSADEDSPNAQILVV